MSKIHIPPISFDDLQTFQAKHFPSIAGTTSTTTPTFANQYSNLQTQAQPHVQSVSYSEPQHDNTYYDEPTEEEGEEEDLDLGYYPDGAKRTLTDEQIRIFRYSEIHALLRERQVRAENEEFERVYGNSGSGSAGAGAGSGKESLEEISSSKQIGPEMSSGAENEENKVETGSGVKRSAAESGISTQTQWHGHGQGAKRRSVVSRDKDQGENVRLDYNEEESVASRPTRMQAAAQFSGRRIISYDD
ncbi:hypothetical protein BJY04DRAFT_23615 [Aspergillus karnatakaensis]|uniref:DUF3807 domain-containing protein n=1 Tax=Aspergillus karnatakaensis TaxID=1810916 RepID=UPI003CCD35CA